MYHTFNIQQFHVLPTQCIYVFCMDLKTNNDFSLSLLVSCALKQAVQAVRLGFPRNSQLLSNVTLRSTANFAEIGQEMWSVGVEINFRP